MDDDFDMDGFDGKEDGKSKVHNLRAWKAEVAAARAALQSEGYNGSMSLKPGLPLHSKILALRARRSRAPGPASGSQA